MSEIKFSLRALTSAGETLIDKFVDLLKLSAAVSSPPRQPRQTNWLEKAKRGAISAGPNDWSQIKLS